MSEIKTFSIEAHKQYVRRDGEITGPLEVVQSVFGTKYYRDPLTACLYFINGRYESSGIDDEYDLVSEHHDVSGTVEIADLPNPTIIATSPDDIKQLTDTIELQAAKIKKLESLLDKKNKIMNDILEMVRYEREMDES